MPFYAKGNYLAAKESATATKPKQKRYTGNPTIPDEVILGMRRMHEIDRKPMTQVMIEYPQYSKHYVRDILNYILRVHLKP